MKRYEGLLFLTVVRRLDCPIGRKKLYPNSLKRVRTQEFTTQISITENNYSKTKRRCPHRNAAAVVWVRGGHAGPPSIFLRRGERFSRLTVVAGLVCCRVLKHKVIMYYFYLN